MEQIKKDSERDYGESEYDEFYNIKGDIQVGCSFKNSRRRTPRHISI